MAPRTSSLLILGFLCGVKPANAGAIIGLDWRIPLPSEALDSTYVVGEYDGVLRPALAPYGGWAWGNHEVLGQVGIAMFNNQEVDRIVRIGNLRLGLDYRLNALEKSLLSNNDSSVSLWGSIGLFQNIPLLKEAGENYSESEQAASEQRLSEMKALLSGTGIRVGVGVNIPLGDDFFLGFHHYFVDYMNIQIVGESTLINTFLHGESGFHAHVAF